MKARLLIISFFIGTCAPKLVAQTDLKYFVKVKPGASVVSFPDNNYTAFASGKDVLIINNITGIQSQTYNGVGNIQDLSISKNGDLLLVTTDNKLTLWDVHENRIKYEIGKQKGSFVKAGFVGSDKIGFLTKTNTISIWDLATNKSELEITGIPKDTRSLALDVKYIAIGGQDGKITVWNATNGEPIKRIFSGSGYIRSLVFDLKGNRLISGSDEGKIMIWNPADGELMGSMDNGKGRIYSLSIASDNKHIAASGSACNLYNLNDQRLVKTIDKVSSDVLDVSFAPDGKSLFMMEDFSTKAKCIDISSLQIAYVVNVKDDTDKTAPQLFISSPAKIINNRVVHYQDLIAIRGSVIDDYGVRQLKINGIKAPVKQNGNFVINLPLSMGDNFVTIEATDVNDNTVIKKFIVSRKNLDGEPYDPTKAKNYLLVIGINKYEYWPQLYNAVKDANDVAKTLDAMYNFEATNTTILTDEQATRSNIYKTLRSYVNMVGPKDNFLIYYSGHGYFDELLNEGYWVPVDARVNSNGDYLSNSDITKIIGNINSQHTFLVADACFSGSLFNEQSRGYAENVEKFKSRWGLASGRLEAVSDGGVGSNSPFTSSFIEYLKTNKKDKVAVSELVQYVKIQVAEVSNQTPIGNPLKGVGDEGGEFVFYKKGD